MKASVPFWTGCIAMGLMLQGAICQAAGGSAGLWAIAAAGPGQFSASQPERRKSEETLREARSAIKRGEFDRAETLIGEAEKLNVKYDPLTERFVDTPEKLRKVLAEERSKATAGKSGFRMPALFGGKPATQPVPIPADPIAATREASDPAAANQTVDQAVDHIAGDVKSRAVTYLKDARAALTRGDKLAALASWQKAAGMNAPFNPSEDSPQRMADDLMRAGIEPSRLIPVSANPAGMGPGSARSPYALRPMDVNPATETLPQLGTSGPASLAATQADTASPYNLPQESNPLVRSGPAAGGAYQPLPPVENAGASPAGATTAIGEPQRLPVGDANSKVEAGRLVAQARLALDQGDLTTAAKLAEQAEALNVPDNAFAQGETRPWQMSLEVNRAIVRREGVVQASGNAPPAPEPRYPVAQGVYNPANDASRTVAASSQGSVLNRPPQTAAPAAGDSPGLRLYQEGLKALQGQDRAAALEKFGEAWKYQDQLDPETRQQLKDKLTFLRATNSAQPLPAGQQPSPLEQVNSQQDLLRQKLMREILNEEKEATAQAQKDPRGALNNLQKLRERVSAAEVDPAAKKHLLTLVDKMVNELTVFVEQNKATIENAERNAEIKADVVRSQDVKIQTQTKLAEMVESFNRLMEEKRFAEAEVIARQARDISPDDPVVTNMIEKAKLARHIYEDMRIQERSQEGVVNVLQSIGESAIPQDDREPFIFGDVRRWNDLTRSRRNWLDQQRKMSPVEREIQQSLSKPVEARFTNRPLSEVMDLLGRMAGINVYLDPQGLNAEGVTTDTPVTLNLTQPISLKSALNLVLSPLGLSYVVQDEVLRITSEQTRNANVYAHAYYVADLVMPIPNFLPANNLALPGALRDGLNALGVGIMPRPFAAGALTVAKNEGQSHAPQTGAEVMGPVLAQMMQGSSNPLPTPQMGQSGPGGWTGKATADFDPLIELITATIAPQSWAEVGGPGNLVAYENNLSLVVSQTQEVHEQLADLLEQLRRLQDLQVTIEVRFISLADNFFERIGVDFDLSIDDNTNLMNSTPFLPQGTGGAIASAVSPLFDDSNKSISIGWTAAGATGDLDLKLDQNNFTSTTPQFGGFDPNAGAQFGFAILSDLEAFFVLQAAQGNSRANILQAPKVTMFNGQFASVTDNTIRPFVTSVIPVVGDFAVAQMPVIVLLTDGMSLSVQAVVSNDRRFVRLTLVPFFSQIGDVQEFTFNGTTTTDSGTTVQDPSKPDKDVVNNQKKTISGTTVQLPTQAVTSVNTTVSVPDGGTVLLGGIKRLREGRTERGVPILSKVPWISRLFNNVGIGREAQSLMMMVSPRIIIQEEEEAKLGIVAP